MRKLFAVLASVLLVAGCSQIKSGTVVDKHYSPAWTQYSTTQQCSGTGTSRICIPIITPTYWPEEYELRLKNSREEGWRNVTPAEYDRYKVGDKYP
ncbi:hypothetical protein [Mycobacteroides abscessus]|uniref:hypothetical protein n=1 Tax=Mycobacteroides abscessus TaxID=36809 RepID=UPI0009A5C4A2|nr:hypothetical protein [Mycobacteroides abscessus]SKT46373.1 Uncharacterised protein [Mycobacteroides abscessus subsp. bolletii]